MSDVLAWIDVETSGLDPVDFLILEIGFRITDLDLNEIARWDSVIHWNPITIHDHIESYVDEFVVNMHSKNGLWQECKDDGPRQDEVDQLASEWCIAHDLQGAPMCGSSLRLDRNFIDYYLPKTAAVFGYRSIDNSTVKELCKRYAPDLYAKLPEHDKEFDIHRVQDCLTGTITEAKFYLDNFIFDARSDA